MFEDRTQENILNELLSAVPSDVNKEEGSLIYATLAACADKLEDAYIDIEEVYDNSFADTCDREHLIRKALERGIEPYPATKAQYKAVFNCEMVLNERFTKGGYTFVLTSKLSDLNYVAECETEGEQGNNSLGEFDSYLGYNEEYDNKGELKELLIPGENEEETETFRTRYFDTVASQDFAGNISAYENFVGGLNGVGAVKVIPCKQGAGTVGIVVMDSQYKTPTQELIQTIQNKVDPAVDVNNVGEMYGLPTIEDYKGKGYGIAPINHDVTVEGVVNKTINVNTTITLEEGVELEAIEQEVNKQIELYLTELTKAWQKTKVTIVRKSYIESRLLAIDGVVDIKDTTINGGETVTLQLEEIPIKGVVTCLTT